MNAILIDDELQSRNLLYKMLQDDFPEIRVVAQASCVSDGLQFIHENAPEIVFLDIEMIGEAGFDLLNQLPEINFALIFTTAYDYYAIKAFRLNAIDYLLKPIIKEELNEAINKAKIRLHELHFFSRQHLEQFNKDIISPGKIHENLAIPTIDGYIIIKINDIIYCQARSTYTEFHMTDQTRILSSYTLKQYDEILSSHFFFRAHRSYLINLDHVKRYSKIPGSNIIMSNGHEIELSRTHKNEFLELLHVK